jgi:hypothetical protein
VELNRFVALGLAALAAGVAGHAFGGEARAAAASLTCTNTKSGAQFQLQVDYDKHTVDSYPARISDSQIAWHDPKEGGNYTLDRKSGDLTFVAPSSTGGYFVFHRCTVAKSG